MSRFSATVEGIEGRRKAGDHLALVRIQAITPQEHAEITEQPDKARDLREEVGPEAGLSQIHAPDSLLPLLPFSLFSTQQPKLAFFLSQIMSCFYSKPLPTPPCH